MTTFEPSEVTTTATRGRPGLRLSLATTSPHQVPLDGVWWPRSRDLETETADLIDNFPATHGRIRHVEYSAPHWEAPDREIRTARGNVKAAVSHRDDAHVVVLTTSTGHTVRLLVLPATMTETAAGLIMFDQAAPDTDQAGARTSADAPSTMSVSTPSAAQESTGDERWVDYGDDFWAPHRVPPSEREWRPFDD